PGVVVAEHDHLGDGDAGDRLRHLHVFVAEVADEHREVTAAAFQELTVGGTPVVVHVADHEQRCALPRGHWWSIAARRKTSSSPAPTRSRDAGAQPHTA